MTEHLLSKDEIDALLHTSAREARNPAAGQDEHGADPEALGQLWRLFLTTTLERWSGEWGRKLSAGPVRVQWGTAEELLAGQPAGALVDVLLKGSLTGAASGRFWTATSLADATALVSLAGRKGPWGDLGDDLTDVRLNVVTGAGGDGAALGGEPGNGDEDGADAVDGGNESGGGRGAAAREAGVPTKPAEALLKAVTSEMQSMSGQLLSEPISFAYEGGAKIISGFSEALAGGDGGAGDDEVLVELSCRLSGEGIEVPISFLLDGESTEALLYRLDEQTAATGELGTGTVGAPAGVPPGALRGRASVRVPGGAVSGASHEGAPFQPGIAGVDRPKVDTSQGVTVSPAQFLPLGDTRPADGEQNLDLILDVPLEVRVELGRTHMQIRDVLDLGKGSVVELDKLAGEPVDVLVNGKLLAKGEVVVIDENFGVKVTDIVSPMERIRDLQ